LGAHRLFRLTMESSLIRTVERSDSGRRPEPILLPANSACTIEGTHEALGRIFIDARERRGLRLEQAAREARILVSYLKMIECGDYSAVPDVLYLLPFFQRYAIFLGLDVDEITLRFMHDFEVEENTGVALSAPSPVLGNRSVPWRRMAQATVIVGVAILVARFVFVITRETSQRPVEVSPSAVAAPAPPVRLKSASTPAQTSPALVAQVAQPAPTTAAAVEPPRTKASRHRHQARGASVQHHRRRHHGPG
jgi:cytoskeletal protein RodZ